MQPGSRRTTPRSSVSRPFSNALREQRGTPRQTEAIREIGLEISLAIREVGAMLVNVGWEQSFATQKPAEQDARPFSTSDS